MSSFLRHPLQPLANHLLSSSLVFSRRLRSLQNYGFQNQQLYFSAIGSDSSSRKQGRVKRKKKANPALQLLEVPDYLIPLAYRQQKPTLHQTIEGREKKGHAKHYDSSPSSKSRGGGFASLFLRSSSSPTTSPHHHHHHHHGTNNATNHSPSRHRRKSASHPSQPPNNNSFLSQSSTTNENVYHNNSNNQSRYPINLESLREMENSLNEKISDYIKERSIGGSGSTAAAAATTITPDLSSTGQLLFEDAPTIDTDFYNSLMIDYYSIILGWCEIAEATCLEQRLLNSQVQGFSVIDDASNITTAFSSPTAKITNGEAVVEDDSPTLAVEVKDAEDADDLLSKYEDAMCRAMRHLDSLESLYRTKCTSIDLSTGIVENEKAGKELVPDREKLERGMTVMDDFASFMGNLFFGSKRDSTNTTSTSNNDVSSSSSSKQLNGGIRDIKLITSLYEQIFLAHHSSFCFGGKVQQRSTRKSNQLLKKWIPLYCCSSSLSSEKPSRSNVRSADEAIYSDEYEEIGAKNIFHTVIRQNVDLSSSIEGVKQAEYWLSSMHSLAQAGYSNCAPDVDTYNLVLLGYCNLCKTVLHSRSKNSNVGAARTRQFIIEGVERIILQLVERKEESCNVNITSLNLVLNALVKAGRDSPDLICTKTNSLLLKLMGEEKYTSLVKIESHDEFINESSDTCSDNANNNCSSDSASQINLEPNLDTYHWLVDIYSTSSDIINIMRSLSLLRRMIQIRNKESQTASASFAPSTGTHIKVLSAILTKVDELSDNSIAKIAKESTEFLDSMVLHGSSLPNHVVYRSLLRLWQRSRSPEAGNYAEEILSRMEISGMYQNDLKIPSGPYFIALSCWLTSATAGRSDAAERAYRLLNIMEAQSGRDDFFSGTRYLESYDAFATSDVQDRSLDPQIQMYSEMLRICAATHENLNSSQSVSIAFDIYDRMIQRDIKPGRRTFESIYKCVMNFVDHHPEAERQVLLQKVYKIASKHGMSRGELLGRYKDSLRRSKIAKKEGQ